MRITTAILKVREHRKAEEFTEVECLVDSGHTYDIRWMVSYDKPGQKP